MVPPDIVSTYFGSNTRSSGGPSLQKEAKVSSKCSSVYQQRNGMNYLSTDISSLSAMTQAIATGNIVMADDHDYAEGSLGAIWASY
jgi:hypothetical protein